jgi:competence protein ComEA
MITRSFLLILAMVGALAMPSVGYAQQDKPVTAPAAGPASAKAHPMDINTASKRQLMSLEGIGEARSDAIIAGRPYSAKDQLVDRKIVPASVYAKIKDQIVAHHVGAEAAIGAPAPAPTQPAMPSEAARK